VPARRSHVWLLAFAATLLTLGLRELHQLRVPAAAGAQAGDWITTDPDSLYHARRLERALAEGRVDGRDPLLPARTGEPRAIPWPPGYTWFLATGARLVGIEAGDRARLEAFVASVPAWLSALTAGLLVLLVAGGLRELQPAGALAGAAVVAGSFALSFASVRYSHFGCGDHHAAVTLLLVGLFGALGLGLSVEREDPRAATRWGLVAGLCAGLSLSVWTASVLHVALVELVLASGFIGRELAPGRVRQARAFHAAALVCLLPAVSASPFLESDPGSLVFLSWTHAVALALAGAAWLAAPRLGASSRRGLAAVAGLLALTLAFTPAVGEGLEWATRGNRFMSTVRESRPLVGADLGETVALVAKYLGISALLLPAAAGLILLGRRVPPRAGLVLSPWLLALLYLVPMGMLQRRFAPEASLACSLVVVFALAPYIGTRRWLGLACALSLPLVLQPLMVPATLRRLSVHAPRIETSELSRIRSERGLAEWLRERPLGAGRGAVLSTWDAGHTIEHIARRPSVANNFGSYMGEESYRAPALFFLAEDDESAEGVLEEWGVRYVIVAHSLTGHLDAMARQLRGEGASDWLESAEVGSTLALRLLELVGHEAPAAPIPLPGFLRLVHLAPPGQRVVDPWSGRSVPTGGVFEVVAGARLTVESSPGSDVVARLGILFPEAERRLIWSDTVRADEEGRATFRVPYAAGAGARNGDGEALGRLTWRGGGRSGETDISEEAVLEGRAVGLASRR